MRLSVQSIFLLAFLLVIPLVSCKEKEKSEKMHMTGNITFDLPAYASIGEKLDLYCTGITAPEGVSYFWTSLKRDIIKDTVPGQRLQISVPDSIGDYTVMAYATYDEYYNSSTSKKITVIDPQFNSTLKGLQRGTDSIVDPRDHQKYYISEIGSLYWFTENLRYKEKGAPFYNVAAMGEVIGHLYSWQDATGGLSAEGLGKGPQGVCPPGWSVPTREDWEDLGTALNDGVPVSFDEQWDGLGEKVCVDATFNDKKVWAYSPDNDKLNLFGWNALPCGYSTDNYSRFKNLFNYGMWWSSTEQSADRASYRYVYYETGFFPAHHVDKGEFGVSVRCVKLKDTK